MLELFSEWLREKSDRRTEASLGTMKYVEEWKEAGQGASTGATTHTGESPVAKGRCVWFGRAEFEEPGGQLQAAGEDQQALEDIRTKAPKGSPCWEQVARRLPLCVTSGWKPSVSSLIANIQSPVNKVLNSFRGKVLPFFSPLGQLQVSLKWTLWCVLSQQPCLG